MKPEYRRPNASHGGRARVPNSIPLVPASRAPVSAPIALTSRRIPMESGASAPQSSSVTTKLDSSISGAGNSLCCRVREFGAKCNTGYGEAFEAGKAPQDEIIDVYRNVENERFRHTRRKISPADARDMIDPAKFFAMSKTDGEAPRLRLAVLLDALPGQERHERITEMLHSIHVSRMTTRDTVRFETHRCLAAYDLEDPKQTAYCTSYYVSMANFLVAWCYAEDLNCICGIITYNGEQSKRLTNALVSEITAQQPLLLNPVLPAYLAQVHMMHAIEDWFVQHLSDIDDAVGVTGNHHNLDIGPSKRHHYNAGELSAKMCGTAFNMATNQNCWEGILELSHFINEELDAQKLAEEQNINKDTISNIQSLRNGTRNNARKAKAMLQEAASWQTKASIQMQGLFNQIAQDNQELSKKTAFNSLVLAEDSKKDSTSMKAIAAVTMCFLPGTFAASLFAIPFFQWDAPRGHEVVSHRIWVYWALTIPLTFATIFIWLLWNRLMNKSYRSKDDLQRALDERFKTDVSVRL